MRLGIIGTGRIASRFVSTALASCQDTKLTCIYNPHEGSAKKFVDQLGISDTVVDTDSVEVFLDMVDVVYVATPHETHYSYAKQMLEAGKHVLCEKPLALKKSEAEELFALSHEKNLVLMEAIKTSFCPGFMALQDLVLNGAIGEIRDVEATFTRLTAKDTREYQNVSYGGSLLEFGSYVMLPVLRFLGTNPRQIEFRSLKAATGVDDYTKVYFEYDNGLAMSKAGLGVKSEGQLVISGTKGYVLVPSPWWMTTKFEVRFEDPKERMDFEYQYESSGLQYEYRVFENEVLKVTRGMDYGIPVEVDPGFAVGPKPGVTENESIALAGIFEKFLQDRC